MVRMVKCIKLEQELEALEFYHIPGGLGKRIYAEVSKEAWKGWIDFQTKLINENRLNLADEASRKYLKQQLEYYFFNEQ